MSENTAELVELRRIIKRLDVLISMMLMSAEPSDEVATARKVEILNAAGLRASEIAQILGISPTHVSVELSRLRKKSAKKKK
ncbi:hypothetical protein [Nitrososphaera sp.]|uniref:hypothetical protein n=1 Tax=Nitrososphaera sp. TaxID=1971748 RepID=UPI0017E0476F|nr:hypothetical protein [Nitrososphaera sp.]NWG37051.1 hypothetical protein [Nitrososphaera sp.]